MSLARVILALFCLFFRAALANAEGSASWNLNPVSEDWNTAENWTPAVVPTNIATFNASNQTDISVSQFLSYADSLVFSTGASAYTITLLSATSLDIYGEGSSTTQVSRKTLSWVSM